jgi:hypothetical protein
MTVSYSYLLICVLDALRVSRLALLAPFNSMTGKKLRRNVHYVIIVWKQGLSRLASRPAPQEPFNTAIPIKLQNDFDRGEQIKRFYNIIIFYDAFFH